jgi:hypothetical protein
MKPHLFFWLVLISFFAILALLFMFIHLWKFNSEKKSPYFFLYVFFGGLFTGSAGPCINYYWSKSRYAPQDEIVRFIIISILSCIFLLSIFNTLKWSINRYKKNLKVRESNTLNQRGR